MVFSDLPAKMTRISAFLALVLHCGHFGDVFNHKCYVHWCDNEIDVFNFHVGHDMPESKGGDLEISNLKPICARCNLSMSNNYTIQEWNKLSGHKQPTCWCC